MVVWQAFSKITSNWLLRLFLGKMLNSRIAKLQAATSPYSSENIFSFFF
jgi:hypothetical protein